MEGGRKMKIIRLRTKIEVFGIICFLITLTTVSVLSVNRTITNSGDNFDTFIRNSKGHYWDCIGANIQTAIDDLGSDGGSVIVGSAVTLNAPIKPKNYVQIDFQGNFVTLGSDISFVNVTACQYAAVRNANVKLTEYHTASIIHLFIPNGGQWADRVRYNTFDNINIFHHNSHWIEGVGWREHNYTGISLDVNAGNMLYNTFTNIKMDGAKNGIHFKLTQTTGWCNGNYFENIWIDQFVTMINFDVTPDPPLGCAFNVFQDVKGQSATFSIDGVKNIKGQGNHFYGCVVWDWWVVTNPHYEWSITNDGFDTVISAHYMSANVQNNGINTMYIGEKPGA